jgi:5'-deoxynucleotidase YfbR-like HD superfamily hydrolase
MIIKTALDIDKKQIVLDGCMVAYSGTIINLYAPLSNTYLLEDIAHQLAFNCRWNGATKTYFSVAEHCCMMYDEAPTELKAVALFHDAEEAYWGDIIKPLKNLLPVATRNLMRKMRYVIISQFLGEETVLPKELDQLDAKMLGWDFDNLILSDSHKGMDCYTAEKEWLKRAYKVLNNEQTPERSVATELNSSNEPLPNKELPKTVFNFCQYLYNQENPYDYVDDPEKLKKLINSWLKLPTLEPEQGEEEIKQKILTVLENCTEWADGFMEFDYKEAVGHIYQLFKNSSHE